MHVILAFLCAILGAIAALYFMRGAHPLRAILFAFGVSYTLYIVAVLPVLFGG